MSRFRPRGAAYSPRQALPGWDARVCALPALGAPGWPRSVPAACVVGYSLDYPGECDWVAVPDALFDAVGVIVQDSGRDTPFAAPFDRRAAAFRPAVATLARLTARGWTLAALASLEAPELRALVTAAG